MAVTLDMVLLSTRKSLQKQCVLWVEFSFFSLPRLLLLRFRCVFTDFAHSRRAGKMLLCPVALPHFILHSAPVLVSSYASFLPYTSRPSYGSSAALPLAPQNERNHHPPLPHPSITEHRPDDDANRAERRRERDHPLGGMEPSPHPHPSDAFHEIEYCPFDVWGSFFFGVWCAG